MLHHQQGNNSLLLLPLFLF